jgi:hypothetical protein
LLFWSVNTTQAAKPKLPIWWLEHSVTIHMYNYVALATLQKEIVHILHMMVAHCAAIEVFPLHFNRPVPCRQQILIYFARW